MRTHQSFVPITLLLARGKRWSVELFGKLSPRRTVPTCPLVTTSPSRRGLFTGPNSSSLWKETKLQSRGNRKKQKKKWSSNAIPPERQREGWWWRTRVALRQQRRLRRPFSGRLRRGRPATSASLARHSAGPSSGPSAALRPSPAAAATPPRQAVETMVAGAAPTGTGIAGADISPTPSRPRASLPRSRLVHPCPFSISYEFVMVNLGSLCGAFRLFFLLSVK